MSWYRAATPLATPLATVLAVALPLAGLAAAWLAAPRLYRDDLASSFPHRESAWAGSATCEACHPDHHASWWRTFHRTMTQEATPDTVLGAFDGRRLSFAFADDAGRPVVARPRRVGERFLIDYLDAGGEVYNSLEIRRTVGSRRYQQYLVAAPGAEGGNLYRIPLLWHIVEERWIHLNGAFLDPDGLPFDAHLEIWNQNCIFCHNTGPEPGMTNFAALLERRRRGEAVDLRREGLFTSEVAELGIACESCHAPAAEHAERNRNPLRRYLLHLTGRDDPTVVQPAKLPQAASVDVCGQCHGQRVPASPELARQLLERGPVYRAGERLDASIEPVTAATPAPGGLVRDRFWSDGTPRLTAYEHQALTMSACYLEGELTCLSCHTLHGGDVRGQIEPNLRTNAACAGCHQQLVDDVAAHSRHDAGGSGSLCYACHMPEMVYGVLEIHRTHRLHNPDPAADAEAARPNACTGCHLERSALWAATAARAWWGEAYRLPERRGDGAPLDTPEVVAALLAGDPVQRAVAARLAGRRDTPLDAEHRAFLWPLLLQGLDDSYPTIRWLSRLSLRALAREAPLEGFLETLERFDYIAPKPRRDAVLAELHTLWDKRDRSGLPPPPAGSRIGADHRLLAAEVAPLLALQANKRIHVGE